MHPVAEAVSDRLLMRIAAGARPHACRGKVADYIPALARVDSRRFGLAVITCDGEAAEFGDAWMPFSIQSISKVFTLTMALEHLAARMGWSVF